MGTGRHHSRGGDWPFPELPCVQGLMVSLGRGRPRSLTLEDTFAPSGDSSSSVRASPHMQVVHRCLWAARYVSYLLSHCRASHGLYDGLVLSISALGRTPE